MRKTTNTTTEKNTTNTLSINKLTIDELKTFLDYAYNSLSSKKETNAKKRMAIDLLKNLKSKKIMIKKSEYTDTVKILLSEFPNLKKFFSNEETKEKEDNKKEDNKKEEVKKETKKEVKKEDTNKKEVKKAKAEETNKERSFPSGIKLERKTFRKVDSITFDEVKKRVDEGKDIIVAYYWSKNDLEVFGYCNADYVKQPNQFRFNLDLAKVIYATDNLIYAISLQTDALYMLTVEDFNRHSDGYLYSGGVEFEVYSSR